MPIAQLLSRAIIALRMLSVVCASLPPAHYPIQEFFPQIPEDNASYHVGKTIASFQDHIALSCNDPIVAVHPGQIRFLSYASGLGWVESEEIPSIESTSPQVEKNFGSALAPLGENHLLVGAPTPMGANQGRLHIYRWSQGQWHQEEPLESTLNTGKSDHFGSSVAISGFRVAVGAPKQSPEDDVLHQCGAVHVYLWNRGFWLLEEIIWPPEQAQVAGLDFGRNVAVQGDWIAVGAKGGANADQKGVYLYKKEGDQFVLQNSIQLPSDGEAISHRVAFSEEGQWLALSAEESNEFGEQSGTIHLYNLEAENYEFAKTLDPTAIDPTIKRAGRSLQFQGKDLYVGSYFALMDDHNVAALRYHWEGNFVWKLAATYALDQFFYNDFNSVTGDLGIHENFLFFGPAKYSNPVRIYDTRPPTQQVIAKGSPQEIVPVEADTPAAYSPSQHLPLVGMPNDGFGHSVSCWDNPQSDGENGDLPNAIGSSLAVVGAPYHGLFHEGEFLPWSGAVYVYARGSDSPFKTGDQWEQKLCLVGNYQSERELFGWSTEILSLDALPDFPNGWNLVFVGAPWATVDNHPYSGQVHVYLAGVLFGEPIVVKLDTVLSTKMGGAGHLDKHQFFGTALSSAISEKGEAYVAVGAPGHHAENDLTHVEGHVYLFQIDLEDIQEGIDHITFQYNKALKPDSNQAGDRFGTSVDMEYYQIEYEGETYGNFALIAGAPRRTIAQMADAGAAYTFMKPAGSGQWDQDVALDITISGAFDSVSANDQFGYSVALDFHRDAPHHKGKINYYIGAPGADYQKFETFTNSGAIVQMQISFDYVQALIRTIILPEEQEGNFAQGHQYIGLSMAAEHGLLAVAAPLKKADTTYGAGVVYLYSDTAGSNSKWALEKISSRDPLTGDFFGYGLDLSSRHLLIGAPFGDSFYGENSGYAQFLNLSAIGLAEGQPLK